jgi:hypothetical protein
MLCRRHRVTQVPGDADTGTLQVTPTDGGIRITGDSDLSTRKEFGEALRMLADMRVPPGQALVLDLSQLAFLDANSTGAILRLAAGLSPPRRLEVWCRAHHRRMLTVLGAGSIRQLTVVVRDPPYDGP